ELEDLVPWAFERRERVESVQAVEGDQVAPHFLLVPRELTSQAEQPSRLLADLFDLAPQGADVDDVDALRVAGVHPERGHLRDEGSAALLHGQVQAGRGALLRLVEQDAVYERGLEGAGRPGDEDDLAARDAAAQPSVQAHDVGRNLVRGLGQRGNPSPAPDGTERSAIALGSIDIFVERFCYGPSRRSKRILKLARTLLPRSHARDGGRRLSI